MVVSGHWEGPMALAVVLCGSVFLPPSLSRGSRFSRLFLSRDVETVKTTFPLSRGLLTKHACSLLTLSVDLSFCCCCAQGPLAAVDEKLSPTRETVSVGAALALTRLLFSASKPSDCVHRWTCFALEIRFLVFCAALAACSLTGGWVARGRCQRCGSLHSSVWP